MSEAEKSRYIGIMGGTFDPVHNGHIVIARSIAEQLQLDTVLFIPTGIPNFKQDQKVTAAAHRTKMVELAIADEPLFKLDRREVEREGITYTADTLEELGRRYPNAHFFFIMGTDSALTLPKWRRAEDVAKMCTVVVAKRPGQPTEELKCMLKECPIEFNVIYLDVPQLDISSTGIREHVSGSKPIDKVVPASVAAYISKNGLYAD